MAVYSDWTGSSSTIRDFARMSHRRALATMSPAQFSRLCLEFDERIPFGTAEKRLEAVLRLLATEQKASTMNLGLIWLDVKGYGNENMEWLSRHLDTIRHAGRRAKEPVAISLAG